MEKTALAFVVFISVFSFSHAQMQKENKWGCSVAINSTQGQVGFFQISAGAASGGFMDADGNLLSGGNKVDNSLSISILPKYFITPDRLVRFEFGITNLNVTSNYDHQYFSTHEISYFSVKSSIIRYALSMQWNIIKEKSVQLYCGTGASYLKYGDLIYEGNSEHRNLPADTAAYWVQSKTTIPGGLAIGIGYFSGINIYLLRHFSLGIEVSSSLLYYKSEGEIANINSSQVLPNPIIDKEEDRYTTSYKGIRISKILSSLNISYWF